MMPPRLQSVFLTHTSAPFCIFECCQADNPERCSVCTTAFFEGQAAIMDPRESWSAKWIRVDNYLPGVYAISVTGQFDREIEEDLENRGIRWRCRPAPN
jgi:transcription elongation factor SPT4